MTKWLGRFISIILVGAGFFGIYIVKIPNYFEFDLWQTLVYLVFGFWGLGVCWYKPKPAEIKKYLNFTTAMLMLWLIIGIPWPNLYDIFHLELLEHFFHLILFLLGVLGLARSHKLIN